MIKYNGMKVYMNGSYPCVYHNNENCHVHRLVWREHFGDIPNNCVIHHVDENKLNWDISNLEMITRGEHIKKHSDMTRRKTPVIAYKDGIRYEFEKMKDATALTGVYHTSIMRMATKGGMSRGGWTFERGDCYSDI